MIKKPKAVLFDWDNTLVDTWPIIHQALHDTFTEYAMLPWTIEEVRERVALSMRDAFPQVFGEKWEEAGERYQQHYRRYHLVRLTPLADVEGVLNSLRAENIPVAVVSNKRNTNLNQEIDHLGWRHHFRSIIGSGDAAKDKPNPEPVVLALAQLALDASPDVWFIGDSYVDLDCAGRAGVYPVFYGDKKPEGEAGQLTYKGFPLALHAPDHRTLHKWLSQG